MSTFTYCDGPSFSTAEPITTATIVRLTDLLHAEFGPGYAFEPEPITEGGLLMTAWPGRRSGGYKSCRFFVDLPHGRWPFIREDTLQQWRDDPPKVIWRLIEGKKKIECDLFLKAFYGAPCWTQEEVNKLVRCLTAVGCRCTKVKIPKKYLRQIGDDRHLQRDSASVVKESTQHVQRLEEQQLSLQADLHSLPELNRRLMEENARQGGALFQLPT